MYQKNPRTVVITGASAGVGRATAIAFASKGWNVGLIARGKEGLEGARRDVEAAGATRAGIASSLADPGAIFAAADQVAEQWGRIDVWINDAMATIFSCPSKISRRRNSSASLRSPTLGRSMERWQRSSTCGNSITARSCKSVPL